MIDFRGNSIPVLDHGFVRLVDYMGSDLSIVRAARVSYDADWRPQVEDDSGVSKDEKLIRYLMKNEHTSPFEMVDFIFEVKAPIFVFRQWHRHRTWSYNEVSARYTQLPKEYYIPDPTTIGTQSAHNKQVRDIKGGLLSDEEFSEAEHQTLVMVDAVSGAYQVYESLLEQGVARELARSVLPFSMYSRMFAKVNLHNLMRFLRLRLHEHAQYEIRMYAGAMLDLVDPIVPIAMKYFRESLRS